MIQAVFNIAKVQFFLGIPDLSLAIAFIHVEKAAMQEHQSRFKISLYTETVKISIFMFSLVCFLISLFTFSDIISLIAAAITCDLVVFDIAFIE